MKNTVDISRFQQGEAEAVFAEVKQNGATAVTNSGAVECILLPPDDYERLMDEVTEAELLTSASQRIENADPAAYIPANHLYESLGITKEMVRSVQTPEIE